MRDAMEVGLGACLLDMALPGWGVRNCVCKCPFIIKRDYRTQQAIIE